MAGTTNGGATGGLWDAELIRRQQQGTLVRVGREGRLLRLLPEGPRRLGLAWVDETALALVEATIAKGLSLNLLYPSPAGDVSVLLAAQILVHALIQGRAQPSVGLVTADPARAAAIWEQLRIESQGAREPLTNVFPYWRASPDGGAAFDGLLRGLVIGKRAEHWFVDVTIVDSLSGIVWADTNGPVIRVFADPLDPLLPSLAARGEPIWGWSEAGLALWTEAPQPAGAIPRVPFSVTEDRLRFLREGVAITLQVCGHAEAVSALGAARGALAELARHAQKAPSRNLDAGLKVAWGHLSTLASLPCRPSEYDAQTGQPPRAARSTATFEREVMSWSRTLGEEEADLAADVATQIGLARAALDHGNPLKSAVAALVNDGLPGVVVVRTRTAARALALALNGREHDFRIGSLSIAWLGQLHTVPQTTRLIVVGAPPRSGWHRIVSGVSRNVRVLVLGDDEARRAQVAWDSLRQSRAYWSSQTFRGAAWRTLYAEEPPANYRETAPEALPIVVGGGPAVGPEVDPFTPLGALFRDDRVLLSDEGPAEQLVEITSQGEYRARTPALQIETDRGYLLLPDDRSVDILVGDTIDSISASALTTGVHLLVGREGGRMSLLEALEDRLKERPDLLGARLLVDSYHDKLYEAHRAFMDSGLDLRDLYDRLRSRGCKKRIETVRGWVTPGVRMGPRDAEDIGFLNGVLRFGYTARRVTETHAALESIRVFRRAAGLAIVRAASAALLSQDDSRINPDMGVSVADLRDAVAVVTVKSIRRFSRLATITEVGRLQQLPFA